MNHKWLWLAAFLAWLFGAGCSQNHAENVESWQEVVKNAKALGVEADVHVSQGDGHFMGQAFNFLGVRWDAHVRVRPGDGDPVASQPSR